MIFDAQKKPCIRYGDLIHVTSDSVHGVRILSARKSDYSLDENFYRLVVRGDTAQLLGWTRTGVAIESSVVSLSSGQVTASNVTVTWTVTSALHVDGEIVFRVGRTLHDCFTGGAGTVNSTQQTMTIYTDSLSAISVTGAQISLDKITWGGSVTQTNVNNPIYIRRNDNATPGRYYVHVIQGQYRYSSEYILVDQAQQGNKTTDIKIGTGATWDTATGVTGVLDTDIDVSTLVEADKDTPLKIWTRRKDLYTGATSLAQLPYTTVVIEADGDLYDIEPPTITSVSTTDGMLRISAEHPDSDAVIVVSYNGVTRRGASGELTVGRVVWGYDGTASVWAESARGKSSVQHVPVDGFWRVSIPSPAQPTAYAGVVGKTTDPINVSKAYGARVVYRVINGTAEILFDDDVVLRCDSTKVYFDGDIVISAMPAKRPTGEALQVVDDTLYFVAPDGTVSGIIDGDKFYVRFFWERQTLLTVPVRDTALYQSADSWWLFRDQGVPWLVISQDGISFEGEIVADSIDVPTIPDYVNGKFRITRSAGNVYWLWDGVPFVKVTDTDFITPYALRSEELDGVNRNSGIHVDGNVINFVVNKSTMLSVDTDAKEFIFFQTEFITQKYSSETNQSEKYILYVHVIQGQYRYSIVISLNASNVYLSFFAGIKTYFNRNIRFGEPIT
mgnify:CR=1 FL=1